MVTKIIYILIIILVLITINKGWGEILKFLNEKKHRGEIAEFYIKQHRTNDDKKTILKRFKKDRTLYNETEKEFQEEQKRKYYIPKIRNFTFWRLICPQRVFWPLLCSGMYTKATTIDLPEHKIPLPHHALKGHYAVRVPSM